MANYYNAQIGVVDASGTVNVIYPITKAANVDYSATINGTAVTTVNAALEKLKTIKAFAYNDLVNLAANTAPTSTSTTAAPTANALTNAYNYLNSNKQAKGSYASSSHTHDEYIWYRRQAFFKLSSDITVASFGSINTYVTSTVSTFGSYYGIYASKTHYFPQLSGIGTLGDVSDARKTVTIISNISRYDTETKVSASLLIINLTSSSQSISASKTFSAEFLYRTEID